MTRAEIQSIDALLTRCGAATMAHLHPNREHPPSATQILEDERHMEECLKELHHELGRLIVANEIHASGGGQPG